MQFLFNSTNHDTKNAYIFSLHIRIVSEQYLIIFECGKHYSKTIFLTTNIFHQVYLKFIEKNMHKLTVNVLQVIVFCFLKLYLNRLENI